MSFRAIAIRNGIKPVTFYARIRRGWEPERACTVPARLYFYEWKG